MNSGLSCIGLFNPKIASNVGAVLRAAYCYEADMVAIEGARNGSLKHGANTTGTQKHIPTFTHGKLLDHRPHDTQVVVIDLIPSAISLVDFIHPKRAMYIFGPEDGTLGKQHTENAQHVVYIPTVTCMNLAATVNVVLYDRLVKMAR